MNKFQYLAITARQKGATIFFLMAFINALVVVGVALENKATWATWLCAFGAICALTGGIMRMRR